MNVSAKQKVDGPGDGGSADTPPDESDQPGQCTTPGCLQPEKQVKSLEAKISALEAKLHSKM